MRSRYANAHQRRKGVTIKVIDNESSDSFAPRSYSFTVSAPRGSFARVVDVVATAVAAHWSGTDRPARRP